MNKRWHDLPYDKIDGNRQVWADEAELANWRKQTQCLAPYDWLMIHKSRDDGPLFYYPFSDAYVWFFNNEMMPFEEWLQCISLDLGNGPRRTEEEQAMLVLTYA